MKKRLLNEHTTRKFMKLAGLQPLSENFFTATLEEEEDELPDEDFLGGEPGDELADEAPLDDLPPEEPMEVGDEGGVDVHALVDAIAAAIQQETGVSVDVEGEAGGEEPELDLGDTELEEPIDDGDPLGDEAVADEEDPMLEASDGTEDVEEEEEDLDEGFLNEVTHRVAKKILELSKKNK